LNYDGFIAALSLDIFAFVTPEHLGTAKKFKLLATNAAQNRGANPILPLVD